MLSRLRQARLWDQSHIALWLIKDSCWMWHLKPVASAMVLPTIGVAVWLAWLTRTHWRAFWPNMAVACWITANSLWMLHEFFAPKAGGLTLIPLATGFFALGLIIMGVYGGYFLNHTNTKS